MVNGPRCKEFGGLGERGVRRAGPLWLVSRADAT
jgi:hypothetical protein